MICFKNNSMVDSMHLLFQRPGQLVMWVLWNEISYEDVGVYSQMLLISSGLGQRSTSPVLSLRIPKNRDGLSLDDSEPLFFLNRMESLTVATTIRSPSFRAS